MVWLLLACSTARTPEQDRAEHQAALALLPDRASEAVPICEALVDDELRADCAWAVVKVLAATDPDASARLCTSLRDTPTGHECWFLLGETAQQPSACANAGELADDCRMHILSRRLWEHFDEAVAPGEREDDVLLHIVGAGFAPDDDRPWSAWYRQLFTRGSVHPALCAAVENTTRRGICERTALPVFHDRLNRGRDLDEPLCTEDPAWAVLDEALTAVLVERRTDDLCDPTKKQAPPP
ncbi:MAG: hypothetical protein GY913_26230 [Proteobacteria bacterium]|nr:hypothetical protein [Pseudomonadota bacterium]MCP4920415.1 hypothetical protein [Pseudomonadota bacterium]